MTTDNLIAIGAEDESRILKPRQNYNVGGTYSTLSTATYKFAVIFPCRENLTIDRIALHFTDWEYGTAPEFRISLQGINANGDPDDTIKADGNAYALFTPDGTANDNRTVWFTLGSSYDATAGELLAIVLQYNSGTINATNTTRPTLRGDCFGNEIVTTYAEYGDGSWTRGNSQRPYWGYGNETTRRGAPINTYTTQAFSSTSNPNEQALRFTLPASLAAAYTIRGLRLTLSPPAAEKTFRLVLYDTDGETEITSRTFPGEQFAAAGTSTAAVLTFDTDPLPLLLAGNTHRLALIPQEADTNIGWARWTHNNPIELDAYPFGPTWHWSTRYNGGLWTDDETIRPMAELLIDTIYPTYPPPDADAIPNFPFVMLSASDGKTPLEGLTVSAETMIDGANFIACTNSPTEKSDGVYLIDLAGADQGDVSTLLKFSAAGALTQYATLIR